MPARRQLLCGNTATMDDPSYCIVALPGIAAVGRFIIKPVDFNDASRIVIAINCDIYISIDRDSN